MTKVELIFFVSDQKKSKDFYSAVLNTDPSLDVPGMTEFQLSNDCKLGLMPSDGIVKLLENKILHPDSAAGIPRSELYLYVDKPVEYFDRAIKAGAEPVSDYQLRNWGDHVCYCKDFDGHLVAFAKKQS